MKRTLFLALFLIAAAALPHQAGAVATAVETLNANTRCTGTPIGPAWTETRASRGPETSQQSRYFEIAGTALPYPSGFLSNPGNYCFQITTQNHSPGGGYVASKPLLNYTVTAQWYTTGTITTRVRLNTTRIFSGAPTSTTPPTMSLWGSTSGTVTFAAQSQDCTTTSASTCAPNPDTLPFGNQQGADGNKVWWINETVGDDSSILLNDVSMDTEGYQGYGQNTYAEFIGRCLASGFAYCDAYYQEDMTMVGGDTDYYEVGATANSTVSPKSPSFRCPDWSEGCITTSYMSVERVDSRSCTLPQRTCTPSTAPTATLSANPTSVNAGGQSTLSYSCTNSTSASLSPSIGALTTMSGTRTVVVNSETTYTLTCTSSTGATATDSVTIRINPTYCQDVTAQVGYTYPSSSGERIALFSETGENAANGGGLNNGNYYLEMCKAECESTASGKCVYEFTNDMGETQASQTQFVCYSVPASKTAQAQASTCTGTSSWGCGVEKTWTAITVPPTCSGGGGQCGGEVTVGINCVAGEPTYQQCGPGERAVVDEQETTKSCSTYPFSYTTNYGRCVPDSTCVATSCVCDSTYQWNGSSWTLYSNDDPSGTCTPPGGPSGSPASLGAPSWGGVFYNLYVYRDGSNYWDSTDPNAPETAAEVGYDPGSCPVSGPDLTMINVAPNSVTAGQLSTFTATVKNNGVAATPNFVSAIFVCPQGDTSCTGGIAQSGWDKFLAMLFPRAYGAAPVKINLSQTSLAAGAQGTQTGTHNFSTAGNYMMRACADNNGNWVGTVTESNENDNCGDWSLLVVNPPGSSMSCSGVASGMSVTWTANPTNLSPYAWTPTETGTVVSGQTSYQYTRTYAAAGSYAMQVRGSNGSTANCPAVPVGGPGTCTNPTVDITATETRVRTGASTTLTVTGSGIGTTCTVTNANTGATITTLTPTSCNVSGSSISTGAVRGQTTYTVNCGTATDSVVVNVIPDITEF